MELIPKSIFCKYIKLILHFVCKVIMPILHKMIILRGLVRLCMIFMVWPVVEPKRWGCWAYGRVFWVNWGLSLLVIWGATRRYKPVEGFGMVGPLDPLGWTKWLYSPKKMLSVGQEVQGFTSAGLRQKAFC